MDHEEIKIFLESFIDKQSRTIVVVDFSNVDKWQKSLGWKVGIKEMGQLVQYFSKGNKQLRRFYYGSDFGQKENSPNLTYWSEVLLGKVSFNHFEIVTKRVKYIHQGDNHFQKKCDLDVEMAVDLIRMQSEYDNIILFSGDGDLLYVLKYLKENLGKKCYVFSSRNHIGKELIDGAKTGIIERTLFAEDFEYRLNADRFKYR